MSTKNAVLPLVDSRDFHNADPRNIKNEYRFFLKTVQSGAVRTLIDAIKEIVVDTNIVFDEKGLYIEAIDITQNAMVEARLNADRFEEYICSERVICGVSLMHLHQLLKTMSSTDILMLFMEKVKNVLEIRIENNRKPKTTIFKLPTLDLAGPDRRWKDNNPVFDHTISIDSAEFHKIVREAKNMGPSLEIQSHKNTLRFQVVEGTFVSEASWYIGVEPSNQSNVLVQGVFSVHYLTLFTKCSPLSKKVNIFLKNDYPLWLQYDVSDLGTIILVLMTEDDPRSENHNSYKAF